MCITWNITIVFLQIYKIRNKWNRKQNAQFRFFQKNKKSIREKKKKNKNTNNGIKRAIL